MANISLLEALRNEDLGNMFESCFVSADKNKTKYIIPILMRMTTVGDLRMGDKGNDQPYVLTQEQRRAAAELLDNGVKFDSLYAFGDWMTEHGMPKITKIFKGDFSGYVKGLESKNRGNFFESDFINNFESKYREDMEKSLGMKSGELFGSVLTQLGGQNNSRPLNISGKSVLVGSKKGAACVGDDVVDVELNYPEDMKKDKLNLSLKWGKTVTFINCGVKKLFPEKAFNDAANGADYVPSQEGKALLDMLGIDYNRFAEVFNTYGGKRTKSQHDSVDVTGHLKGSRIFKDFMESVVGYGYILVHQYENGETHYYDLSTARDMKKFIGNLQSAEIQYPTGGSAKRVNVKIEFDKLSLNINIRSKDGSVNPTHIMADYIVKN